MLTALDVFGCFKKAIVSQVAKTVRRPSRLFFGPFFIGLLALLRHPRLVPLVLRMAPGRLIQAGGGKTIFVEAGYRLLQNDRPEEAWLCLQHYLRLGRPSIDEILLAGNCLYQGLGRRRDATALLVQAGERELEDAARRGLSDYPIRVLDSVWARHIGHLGLVDYVIKRGILEGRRRGDTILYVPPGSPVANRFLLTQIDSRIRVVENPADLPFPASAVQALHYDLLVPRLPNHAITHYWEAAAETYAQWHREGRGSVLAYPADMQARGRATLEKAGVPRGSWFVALHVREREPDGGRSTINSARNADIASYLPAVAEVGRRGGWVVRIGEPNATPLPVLPGVIDYCRSADRADWMDIFILACSRFLIGTNSGPAFVPALYGVPAVLTNWWPAGERPWRPSDIFVPKLLRKISDGSYLTLGQTLCEPFGWSYSKNYLTDRAGVRLEDNDSETIRAAVCEMLERLDGNSQPDMDVDELRVRADRIYDAGGVVGMGRLAGEFVRRYATLIA
ncbi:MAG: TIGR04372 family glycosyltransferase [Xanthobacteraceae bacterium]